MSAITEKYRNVIITENNQLSGKDTFFGKLIKPLNLNIRTMEIPY